jgi:peptidoglycan-associated lipoprotein
MSRHAPSLPLLAAPLALLAAACAHEEKQVQAPAPPPPIVAQAQPAPAEASPGEVADTAALKQLLSGPIAYFDFDRTDLTPDDRAKLQALAQALRAHPGARIRIAGNTDEIGTEEYNMALGQRRADVARTYLITLGITPGRIDTVSYGENRPAVPGGDAAARAKNRRDEAEPISSR